jgi:tetratricopeptide (TPR) repeat protein
MKLTSSEWIANGGKARDNRDWEDAGAASRKALCMNPRLPAIGIQYAPSLKEQGNLLASEEAYRKALELSPEDSDGRPQLGHALKLQDKPQDAAKAYTRALAIDPVNLGIVFQTEKTRAAAELTAGTDNREIGIGVCGIMLCDRHDAVARLEFTERHGLPTPLQPKI